MSLAIQAGQALAAESKSAIPYVSPVSAPNVEAEKKEAPIREGLDSFGKRLAYARKQAGLTQKQLAEKMGVSASAISGYETGKREPDQTRIKALSDTLKVSVGWLVTGKPETLMENVANIPCWYIRRYTRAVLNAVMAYKEGDEEGEAAYHQAKAEVEQILFRKMEGDSINLRTIDAAIRYERFIAEMKAKQQAAPPPQNVIRVEGLIDYQGSEDQDGDLEGGESHGAVARVH